jgi:hypothetical protein
MALFIIKRVIGESSQTDVDAAIFRARACAYDFPGLRWVHSYWHREAGITYCIYEAESKEQIVAHSQRASLICDEVWPVSLLAPEQYRSHSAWIEPEVKVAVVVTPEPSEHSDTSSAASLR